MTKSKPKFNKHKCLDCIYHQEMPGMLGYQVRVDKNHYKHVYCNFSSVTRETCLRVTENGVIDIRGNDFDNCQLFVKGKAKQSMQDNLYLGSTFDKNVYVPKK